MSTVDIIVPCYGYARFLSQCIESVLTQCAANDRILIIDDASPDNTGYIANHLASEHRNISVVRHAENRGHIATYNEGLSWAKADYVALLSADDYLLPGALHRVSSFMDAHPEVTFTFGKAVDLTGTVKQVNTLANRAVDHVVANCSSSILEGDDFFRLIEWARSVNIVRSPTVVVRTDIQHRVGGYRPELPHSGDLEMWLRLATYGQVGVLAAYQAVYRLHNDNMQCAYYGSGFLPDLEQRRAALDSIFNNTLGNAREHRKKLLMALGREAIQRASAAFAEGDASVGRRLEDFALAVDPDITTSMAWFVLRCKRHLGSILWSGLRTVQTHVRGFFNGHQ